MVPRTVRNREIMLRALSGQSPQEIAEIYDLAPGTITAILSSPLVKQEMERYRGELQKEVVAKVREASHEALETIKDTMRGDVREELRFKAAREILERNPDLKPQRDQSGEFAQGLGESIIRALAQKLAQRVDTAGGSGEVVQEALAVSGERGEGNGGGSEEVVSLPGEVAVGGGVVGGREGSGEGD